MGGVDTYHLVDKFEGIEKIQCQSLMSWVNDGSHYAPDELYVAISDNMAANYLKIFFKIFKAAKHDAHYKMMMGDSYVDLDPEDISEQQPMTTVGEEGNTVFDGAAVKEPSTPYRPHSSLKLISLDSIKWCRFEAFCWRALPRQNPLTRSTVWM